MLLKLLLMPGSLEEIVTDEDLHNRVASVVLKSSQVVKIIVSARGHGKTSGNQKNCI